MKYSLARKKDWAKLTPEEKSKRARHTAILKWKKVSPEDRLKHSIAMNKAQTIARKKAKKMV